MEKTACLVEDDTCFGLCRNRVSIRHKTRLQDFPHHFYSHIFTSIYRYSCAEEFVTQLGKCLHAFQ